MTKSEARRVENDQPPGRGRRASVEPRGCALAVGPYAAYILLRNMPKVELTNRWVGEETLLMCFPSHNPGCPMALIWIRSGELARILFNGDDREYLRAVYDDTGVAGTARKE